MSLCRSRSCTLALFALFAVSLHAKEKKPEPAKAQSTMSAEQTAKLFQSMDEVLQFVSADSHLKILHSVKREMVSRSQVNELLVKKFNEDESARRMERSELVLKKFGLLDRDFHLRPFMISLLTEQIAGFYDAKTGVMHMLDWVPVDDQKTVMAHELTHALQDQRVHLGKWGDATLTDVSKDLADDRRHVEKDEATTAREAVTEGQAMVVFVDYMLKPMGKTLATSPELLGRMHEMQSNTGDSPIMARAPLLLQQVLLFPYTAGMDFEAAVLADGGVDHAFAGVLDHPPSTSREILHPSEYLSHAVMPVLTMPDVHPLLDKDWAPYDIGVLGEFDVRLTAELFGGKEMSAAIGPAWDGGIYYAAQRKAATPQDKTSTASIALTYYSQWKNADSALSFMRLYAAHLGRKYRSLKETTSPDATDARLFTTEEGDVTMTLKGSNLFISEGFDRATAKQLETLFRESQGIGPLKTAKQVEQPSQDPVMQLSGTMGAFGTMHAAVQVK